MDDLAAEFDRCAEEIRELQADLKGLSTFDEAIIPAIRLLSSQLKCPWCMHRIESSLAVEKGTKPKPGDVSICMYCAEPSVFGIDMQHHKPDEMMYQQIVSDPRVREARRAVKSVKRDCKCQKH